MCNRQVGDSNLTAVLTEQNRPAPSVRLMGPYFGPYVRRTYFPCCLNHKHDVCQFTRSFCESVKPQFVVKMVKYHPVLHEMLSIRHQHQHGRRLASEKVKITTTIDNCSHVEGESVSPVSC